ncbi:MAG: tryptophan--tRNA ligase [Alphaproteobacteria bacterium]
MNSPVTNHQLPSTAKRILSGVQPTGNLHLGNYLGAIRNWVALQQDYECFYMLADLHAITVPQDPEKLRASVRESAAALIACGVDPKKSAIFPQSCVTAHAELNWILACHTPLGWLNRMTQFKEKAGKDKEKAVLGLYAYPVLMAADILLYKATHVPVGEDQKQHIELTRDIAGAYNRYYNQEYFMLPEPLILGEATRVMSLRDGKKKMSKSDESDYSRINLTDDADTIALKFRKAKSDMIEGISWDPENRPEVANLLTMYASFKNVTREAALKECDGKNFSTFKQMLTDAAVAHLSPITGKMRELMADRNYLDAVLKDGSNNARAVADKTIREVKESVGFLAF